MRIRVGQKSKADPAHLCFNERDEFFDRISRQYPLDSGLRDYLIREYAWLVKVWNRFVSFKARLSSDDFYYSCPIASAIGYPPDAILSLGIIRYVQANRSRGFVLHTQHRELQAYFGARRWFWPRPTALKTAAKLAKLVLDYALARIFLPLPPADGKSLFVHSYHHPRCFSPEGGYRFDRFPDMGDRLLKAGFRPYPDINPNFFPTGRVLELRRAGCVFAPAALSWMELLDVFRDAFRFASESRRLFGVFAHSCPALYGETFFNLLKVRSIIRLARRAGSGSHYVFPWEGRGYELGVERELGPFVVQYACGILSRVSTEWVTYREPRHAPSGHYVAMSARVRDLLREVRPELRLSLARSPRVFRPLSRARAPSVPFKGLLICPIERRAARRLVRAFSGNIGLEIRVKPHPYCPLPEVPPEKLERRPLSQCLPEYDIAIYSGFTSASVEAYFSGLAVARFADPNRLPFDAMDDLGVPEISGAERLQELKPAAFTSEVQEYYLGPDSPDFGEVMSGILAQTGAISPR